MSFVVVALGAVVAFAFLGGGEGDDGKEGGDNPSGCGLEPVGGADARTYEGPPQMALEDGVDYSATVRTSLGPISMDLLEDDAPETVNNFVCLARDNFYDGLTWHRIEEDLVIQGGDPQGTGAGGPGYSIPDELPQSPDVYTFGAVGMANSGPDTGGSQFFIVVRDPSPEGGYEPAGFPPNYSVFGQVDLEDDASVETLQTIATQKTKPGTPEPVDPITIESVEIFEQ